MAEPDSPLAGAAPAGEEGLRLARMLMRAEGFALAFARVNLPARRDALARAMKAHVAERGLDVVEVHLPAGTDLLALLAERVTAAGPPGPARRVVFVYGLEQVIPSSELYHPALAVLNLKREQFRARLALPVVFWVPEYVLRAIAEGAPDFWAWRSGVYEFSAPEEEVARTLHAVPPERGPDAPGRLSGEEKRSRAMLLAALLAEYEARHEAGRGDDPLIRLDLSNRLGQLHQALGETNEALACFTRALGIARSAASEAETAAALHRLGLVHQARSEYPAALACYEQAARLRAGQGDSIGLADTIVQIGIIHQRRGDYPAALAQYEQALRRFEQAGDSGGTADALHQIGILHQHRGDFTAALAYYERALALYEARGDRAGIARSRHQMGRVHQDRGDDEAALDAYAGALALAEALGDRGICAGALHQTGILRQSAGDYPAALAYYQQALGFFEEIGDRTGAASTRGQIGRLLLQMNRPDEAFTALLQAHRTFRDVGSPYAAVAASSLRDLRRAWGPARFDPAWRAATGAEAPGWITGEP